MPCCGCTRWIQNPAPGRAILVIQDVFTSLVRESLTGQAATPVPGLSSVESCRTPRPQPSLVVSPAGSRGFLNCLTCRATCTRLVTQEATASEPAVVTRWCRSCRAFFRIRSRYIEAVAEKDYERVAWFDREVDGFLRRMSEWCPPPPGLGTATHLTSLD
jgi:hypothetical protein